MCAGVLTALLATAALTAVILAENAVALAGVVSITALGLLVHLTAGRTAR